MPQKKESWTPPVEFYFQVQFHFRDQRISASFMEVGGLEQEIITEESGLAENDGTRIKLLKEIRHGNITLKRSLEPVSEKITAWVKGSFSYIENGRISPCMLVIFLMDSKRHAVACWACSHAYPIKWSLSTLDAQKSGLAIETLTLTYNRIERKK
ncbi:MAG: phage tail protein [Dysgonomonas sp.]|nr:phage tail protein [Dysgonomonas sp.]